MNRSSIATAQNFLNQFRQCILWGWLNLKRADSEKYIKDKPSVCISTSITAIWLRQRQTISRWGQNYIFEMWISNQPHFTAVKPLRSLTWEISDVYWASETSCLEMCWICISPSHIAPKFEAAGWWSALSKTSSPDFTSTPDRNHIN